MKRLLTLLFILIQTTDFAQVELLKFDAINLCDSVPYVRSKIHPHLHSINRYKDSLSLKVRLYENCGLDSKQGAIITKNDTLILMWTDNNNEIDKKGVVYENGTWFSDDSLRFTSETLCDCYIEIAYTLKGIREINHIQVYNRNVVEKDSVYRLYEPTFKIFEGDTVNYTDSLGVKKGKWMEFDSLGRVVSIEIKSSHLFSEEYESFEYHDNGKLALHTLTIETRNGFTLEEKYYKNGNIKERLFQSFLSLKNFATFDVSYKEYFNKRGKLKKRELLNIDNDLYKQGYFYE